MAQYLPACHQYGNPGRNAVLPCAVHLPDGGNNILEFQRQHVLSRALCGLHPSGTRPGYPAAPDLSVSLIEYQYLLQLGADDRARTDFYPDHARTVCHADTDGNLPVLREYRPTGCHRHFAVPVFFRNFCHSLFALLCQCGSRQHVFHAGIRLCPVSLAGKPPSLAAGGIGYHVWHGYRFQIPDVHVRHSLRYLHRAGRRLHELLALIAAFWFVDRRLRSLVVHPQLDPDRQPGSSVCHRHFRLL